jgi:hypothetical protein
MTQNQHTGAAANKYGRETARLIMKELSTEPISKISNECMLDGRRVAIKCSRAYTKQVGVSYKMLERLDGVIGAFETNTGNYELYEISPETFKQNMRETRSTGAAAGKVALVLQKIFEEESEFIPKGLEPSTFGSTGLFEDS